MKNDKKYVPKYNSHRRNSWIQLDCIFSDILAMLLNISTELYCFFNVNVNLMRLEVFNNDK